MESSLTVRLILVKTSSLKDPLNRFMMFGQFKAKVIHKRQIVDKAKCSKCLELGHNIHDCTNQWKCTACFQSGHRKGDCTVNDIPNTPVCTSDSSSSDDETPTPDDRGPSKGKQNKHKEKKQLANSKQSGQPPKAPQQSRDGRSASVGIITKTFSR